MKHLRLERDPALKDVSVEVNLLGVQDSEANKEAVDVNQYWNRALQGQSTPGAIKLHFSPGEEDELRLRFSGTNETDRAWRSLLDKETVQTLVVISDYPRAYEAGEHDPRRRVFKLKGKSRVRLKELVLKVDRSGINTAR